MVRQPFSAGARAYVARPTVSTDLLMAIAKLDEREAFVSPAKTPVPLRNFSSDDDLQRSAALERAFQGSEERFRAAVNNLAEGLYSDRHSGFSDIHESVRGTNIRMELERVAWKKDARRYAL
jgi:hypothetical protein